MTRQASDYKVTAKDDQLAQLEPWAIYDQPAQSMPTSPRRIFLPLAVQMVAANAGASSSDDVVAAGSALPGWDADVRRIAGRLAIMLRAGSMSSHARPVAGQGSFRLSPTHWDHDRELEVVASGLMNIADASGGTAPHWIFLEEAEVALLADIVALVEHPLSPYVASDYQLQCRVEVLSDLLMVNLGAIVRGSAPEPNHDVPARPEPSPSALAAMLSEARLSMTPTHRDALVKYAAAWLEDEFGKEQGKRLSKATYRRRTVARFGDIITSRTFDRVWVEATQADPRRRQPGRI